MSEIKSGITSIALGADEALVLFELLQRFCEGNSLTIKDEAEARVLSTLCGMLEKQLAAPFASNYKELLADARDRLLDRE